MSKIVLAGRSSTDPNDPGSILVSEFGEDIWIVDWSEAGSVTPEEPIDLLILDLTDPERLGFFLNSSEPSPQAGHRLAFVANGLEESFLFALTRRVDDVMTLPCSREWLLNRVRRFLETSPPTETDTVTRNLVREFGLQQVVGQHPSFRAVLDRIDIIARVDLPALILGETGTGKEVCARAIHALSSRRDRPFVPVECGAIPVELAESELFGHARGAYTDARTATTGVVGMAEGGTLFLDEIDSLSLSIQSKLLRFLQEGTYRSLGSDRLRQANVRIIAASNRSLTRAVADKLFRDDLFFRLSVLRIELPPLRERPSDIALLASHFLAASQRFSFTGPKVLSREAVRRLENHPWPGNVRELSNVISRAVLFSAGPQILARDISFDETTDDEAPEQVTREHNFRLAKANAVKAFEKQYLASILQECGGNITRAATAAGQDRSAFRRMLRKHGIVPAGQA